MPFLSRSISLILFYLLLNSLYIQAATKTWDGGSLVDNNWTTAANWDSDIAPVAGDALVFTGSSRTSPVNDFTAGTNFTSLTLTGASGSSSSFTLSGNALVLTGGSTAIANNSVTPGVGGYTLSISLNITFSTAAPTIALNITTQNGLTISGNIDNGGFLLTASNTGSNTNMNLTGAISGSGGFVKTGSAIMAISGNNTFTGGTTISQGTLRVASSTALGASGSTVTINSGVTIDANPTTTLVNYSYVINGSFNYLGTRALNLGSGSVTLNANATITSYGTNDLTIGGVVSGAYNLIKASTNTGDLAITNTANTYTGTISSTTNGSSGSIIFTSIQNVGGGASSLGAPITIPNGTISLGSSANPGTLDFQGTSNYSSDRIVNLASTTGQVSISANGTPSSSTISFTSNATVTGDGAKTFSLQGTNTGDNTFSGIIPDAASNATSFDKSSAGTWLVSGVNTFSGASTISAGTLKIGSSSALGNTTGSTTITSGAVIDLNGINYSSNEALTINGTGITSFGALMNSSATGATYAGLITLGSTSSIVGGTGTINLSNTGTITGSGYDLTLDGNAGGTLASILGTGAGALVKSGNGTWTLSGANTYTGSTTVSGGILKLNNASALGTIASGTTVSSGAAIDLNGITYSTAEALSITGTGYSSSGALLNSNATASSFAGDITLAGATTITADNQITLSGNITNSQNLTKLGTSSLVFTNNTVSLGSLTISTGTLDAGASTINLTGNFSNSATFTPSTSTVIMNGSSAQTISAATFNNLTIVNAAGVSLIGNITVNGVLTLTTGVLNTGSYTITLGSSATIAESNPSVTAPTSYVTGYVSTTRNLIQNVANTFGGIGISLTETTQASNSTVVTRRTGTASTGAGNQSILRYFDVTPTVDTNLSGTMVFSYIDAELNSQTEANFKLYKSSNSGSTWAKQASSSVNTGSNTLSLSSISSFSRWTASNIVTNALPVEYINFSATKETEGNILKWETSQEINNEYFDVERSHDGMDFEKITSIKGVGTTNSISNYSYLDKSTNQTLATYYRLKQVDFDKKAEYSNIVFVNGLEGHKDFHLYPNPLEEGNKLYACLGDNDEGIIKVSVFDISGKLLQDFLLDNIENASNITLENENLLLQKGMYIVEIKSIHNDYKQKLEVK